LIEPEYIINFTIAVLRYIKIETFVDIMQDSCHCESALVVGVGAPTYIVSDSW